jgi:DNA replicative helicase MCM subunit Mcm2 (Cdc46/Mcm family)
LKKQEKIGLVPIELLKKYIVFAKSQKLPGLEWDVIDTVSDYYAVLRNKA